MQRWEYDLRWGSATDLPALVRVMNECGEQGWEVIELVVVPKRSISDAIAVLLKRPKTGA